MAGDRLIGVYKKRVIYALDVYDGSELKTKWPGGGFPYQCSDELAPRTVAVTDGAVFFVDRDAAGTPRIKALQLADGAARAGWNPPDATNVTALAGFPGLIVAVTSSWDDGTRVGAYNTNDGSVAWTKGPFAISDYTSGALACASDAMFFVANNQLYGVNSDFGDPRFPKKNAAEQSDAPAGWNLDQTLPPLLSETALICAGDGVYAFDRKKGTLKWSVGPDAASAPATWRCAMATDGKWLAAVRSDGRVIVIECATGAIRAEARCEQGGVPVIGGRSIYVVDHARAFLTVFHLNLDHSQNLSLDRWQITKSGFFSLGEQLASIEPTIGNGSIFLCRNDGTVVAKRYSGVVAAHFDGTVQVDVTPDPAEFSFGTGDVTMEAWVRSTSGGEILSGYPDPTAANAHGFRFNLGPMGEVRFAAFNATGSNQDLARTNPTCAADGNWHHIAVARKSGRIVCYLDGVLQPTLTAAIRNGQKVYANGEPVYPNGIPIRDTATRRPAPEPCPIDAQQRVTIGAWTLNAQTASDGHFRGLLREVRLWDLGLDAVAIQSRMGRTLPPTVNHARGNWHLDENENGTVRIVNDVEGHRYEAAFANGRSVVTDLELDDSAFPYLLHQPAPQWPYPESWIVRGEEPVAGSAAVSTDGVVCFVTNNALYGVRKSDGLRRWSIPIAVGCSTPTAWGHGFLVMTNEFGLIRVEARTGDHHEVDGFQGLQPSGEPISYSAPAISGGLIAAAAPDGRLWVVDPAQTKPQARTFALGVNPSDLVFQSGAIYAIAGEASARKLCAVNLASGQIATTAVGAEIFAAYEDKVFLIGPDQRLVRMGPDLVGPQAAAATVTGGHITGLSADPDSNRLAVTTDSGEVVGLAFTSLGEEWRRSIPAPPTASAQGRSPAVNPPVVSGRNLYCTTKAGAVAALDGRSGEFRGLLFAANPAITPPIEDRGVLYFGCAHTGPKDPIDGALHTAVIGTRYALRLGVTPLDKPDAAGYAIVKPSKTEDLLWFRDPKQCSVEAWVNTTAGGEIISVCPTMEQHAGLRMWLDPAAGIRFRETHQDPATGKWRTVDANAPLYGPAQQQQNATALSASYPMLDGHWHHVAVISASETEIHIFFDGKALTVTSSVSEDTPAQIAPSFLAYLGADATQSGSNPANFFQGMIAEVRLWDTFLDASEISARMQERLRGDEPNLLAYWKFDEAGVHDASRNGRDGYLSGPGATFWLTDLHFEEPDSPYIKTEAVYRPGDSSLPAGDPHRAPSYRLTLTVCKGNDVPFAGQSLQFWYVRHVDAGEPETIYLLDTSTTIKGILPLQPEPPSGADVTWFATSDKSGKIVVDIACDDDRHGPSLDVRAPFLRANERYHVNVLLDKQHLGQMPPPRLFAQCKLIQDYHWSPGSKIDSSRERPVYRLTLSAINPDNSPRCGERIEVSTASPAMISAPGGARPVLVTEENAQEYLTDSEGQVTILIDAKDLKPPTLMVWAGFMAPGARYTVSPAEDAHNRLAAVQGEDMTTNRMKSWRPDNSQERGGPVMGPLLKQEHHGKAPQTAAVVRHMMAAGTASSSRQSVGAAVAGFRMRFADMAQRAELPRGDQIRAIPTLRHIKRAHPVTHQQVLKSIQEECPGALGFEFSVHPKDGLQFRYLSTHEEVKAARGTAGPFNAPPLDSQPMADAVKNAWDKVVHTAEDLAENATRIVVSIANGVNLALETLDGIIHQVVHTIEDAVNAVVSFLIKLALEIYMIIQFLLMLFDFEAIIKAHRILRQTFRNLGPYFKHVIGDGAIVHDSLAPLVALVQGQEPVVAAAVPGTSGNGIRQDLAQDPTNAANHANSVGARSMYGKLKDHTSEVSFAGAGADAGDSAGKLTAFTQGLIELVPQLPTMNASDIAQALLHLVRTTAGDIIGAAADALVFAAKTTAQLLDSVIALLDQEIDIPFISTLYKWITGDDLSMLDLICLVLAVIVHVAYLLVTGNEFYKDAEHLPDLLVPRVQLKSRPRPMALAALAGDEQTPALPKISNPLDSYSRPDGCVIEECLVAFRTLNVAMQAGTDFSFAAFVPKIPNPFPERDMLKIFRGLSAMTVSTLSFVCSTPDFLQKIINDLNDSQGKISAAQRHFVPGYYHDKCITLFAFDLFGGFLTFAGGLKGWLGRDSTQALLPGLSAFTVGRWPKIFDVCEFAFLSILSLGHVALMIRESIEVSQGAEYSELSGDVGTAAKLLFARDILDSCSRLPGFLYTRTAAFLIPNKTLYYVMSSLRAASEAGAASCHGVAEFKYLGFSCDTTVPLKNMGLIS